jgi:LuxR family transcriptional regulator
MQQSVDLSPFSDLAPAGYYVALRVGFAFPIIERNALPRGWVREYTASGFMVFDPVMRWLYASRGATRWSAIADTDPKGVLGRAKEHGLVFGAAIAYVDPLGPGQRSFGSFARGDREYTDDEMRELERLIQRLHQKSAPPKSLTEAELQVLTMVKNGMLVKEIAGALGLAEGVIKQRLKTAKQKLGAKTSSQAAAIATDFGLV